MNKKNMETLEYVVKNLILCKVQRDEILRTILELKDTLGFTSKQEAIDATNRIIQSLEDPQVKSTEFTS